MDDHWQITTFWEVLKYGIYNQLQIESMEYVPGDIWPRLTELSLISIGFSACIYNWGQYTMQFRIPACDT